MIRKDECGFRCSLTHSEGEHDQHIEADSAHALISQVAWDSIPIDPYSFNIWVIEALDIPKDPKVMSAEDMVVAQSKDPTIREIKCLISKNKLKGYNVYSWDLKVTKQYPRQHSHLVLHTRVLYRYKTPSKEDQNALQLVISQSYQKKAIQGCHDDIGHLGLQHMLDLLQDLFYWLGMTKDAELHIARCDQCIWFKSNPQRVVMENIHTTHPLLLVHLDYLMIKVTGWKECSYVNHYWSFYEICTGPSNIFADF